MLLGSYLIENWATLVGVLGTIIGLWISWRLRGHPALTHVTLNPRSAVPGQYTRFRKLPWHDLNGKELMVFKARFQNSGTSHISRPSKTEIGLWLACSEGWEFAGVATTPEALNEIKMTTGRGEAPREFYEYNGPDPKPKFGIPESEPQRLIIDFENLEPGQYFEFKYYLRRNKPLEDHLLSPVAVGQLIGSLRGVRNRRTPVALISDFALIFLINAVTALASISLTLISYTVAERLIPTGPPWLKLLLIALIILVLHAATGVISFLSHIFLRIDFYRMGEALLQGRFPGFPMLIQPAIALLGLLATVWATSGDLLRNPLLPILIVGIAAMVLTETIWLTTAYNPTAKISKRARGNFVTGHIFGSILVTTLILFVLLEISPPPVAFSAYLLFFSTVQVIGLYRARKAGERRSSVR